MSQVVNMLLAGRAGYSRFKVKLDEHEFVVWAADATDALRDARSASGLKDVRCPSCEPMPEGDELEPPDDELKSDEGSGSSSSKPLTKAEKKRQAAEKLAAEKAAAAKALSEKQEAERLEAEKLAAEKQAAESDKQQAKQ